MCRRRSTSIRDACRNLSSVCVLRFSPWIRVIQHEKSDDWVEIVKGLDTQVAKTTSGVRLHDCFDVLPHAVVGPQRIARAQEGINSKANIIVI